MITVTGLTKHFGRRLPADHLTSAAAGRRRTCDGANGRVPGFVGPNGAGKSTTMRMMVGLTRPDGGDVRYDGIAYADLLHPARGARAVPDARGPHPGRT